MCLFLAALFSIFDSFAPCRKFDLSVCLPTLLRDMDRHVIHSSYNSVMVSTAVTLFLLFITHPT